MIKNKHFEANVKYSRRLTEYQCGVVAAKGAVTKLPLVSVSGGAVCQATDLRLLTSSIWPCRLVAICTRLVPTSFSSEE